MKLLYGIVGEGMGHATRSGVILEHLLSQGHEVQIVVSGRAAEYLGRRYPNVGRIEGLKMVFEDNTLDR
ncbi:MAG: teichoic acid biosynthesis protein, partial [Deltaproteobacteria bacterium]|nr:teichoic acid biosynthesis protein [Deltaproteobacteria bacterium]